MWIECYDYFQADRWFFWPILWGLLFCVAGVTMILYARKDPEERKSGLLPFYIWTGFALLWTIGVGSDIIARRWHYKAILANRQYQETEGPVEHFSTYFHQKWRTQYDRFTVNQAYFDMKAKGFRKVPADIDSSGQALADGRWVKVQYEGGVLLKLWVKQKTQHATAE